MQESRGRTRVSGEMGGKASIQQEDYGFKERARGRQGKETSAGLVWRRGEEAANFISGESDSEDM